VQILCFPLVICLLGPGDTWYGANHFMQSPCFLLQSVITLENHMPEL
jgi:hypothetical protein